MPTNIYLAAFAIFVTQAAMADTSVTDFSRALPLGRTDLSQSMHSTQLAQGVTHITLKRGSSKRALRWHLMGEVARSQAEIVKLSACFTTLALQFYVKPYHIAGAVGATYHIVSGGQYASRATAEKTAASSPCKLVARHDSEDESNLDGPWVIDLIVVKPNHQGLHLAAVAANATDQLRQTSSTMARGAKAIAAINGGFFVEQEVDGYPGQPAGISILAGRINSSPVAQRPAVVLADGKQLALPMLAIVGSVDWNTYLEWDNGTQTQIDGINRKVGLVRNCGRGDVPIHDQTCSYADDLVYYPAGSRFARLVAHTTGAVRFALDTTGRVRELDAAALPSAAEAHLVASGARITEMMQQARTGKAKFKLQSSVMSDYGAGVSVVNAGPTLVRAGVLLRNDAQEGWAIDDTGSAAHQMLMHDWINRRNPRTAIGVRKDGTVILLAVDGRRHTSSVGLTIEELRQLMSHFGAQDAVNLDGGGSTAMVVRGRLVNHPSDKTGERKVGDAIVLTGVQR
jgi:hypothetical protein